MATAPVNTLDPLRKPLPAPSVPGQYGASLPVASPYTAAAPPGTLTPPSATPPQGTLTPPSATPPPGAPPPPPGAPPPAPAPGGGLAPEAAAGQLSAQFQKQFGREITPAETAMLQQNIGWTPGAPITPEMMTRASALIQGYSGTLPPGATTGATPPPPPPGAPPSAPGAPPAPGGGLAPEAAANQLSAQFQQKFGRAITPEETAMLQKNIGWTPGTPITPEMMTQAGALINGYSGTLPGAVPPGPPGPAGPAPVSGTQLEAQQRVQLMALLRGETPVTLNRDNPAVAAERSHFDRANSQATTRQRLASSERAAARGTLGSGGFDAGLAGIENDSATRSTGFEAELMKNERQGQIDRLMASLGMTQQYGATQLQGQLGRGQLGLGYLNAMLNDRQAGNATGFNYAQLQNQMNNQAIQALLSGGG